MQSEYEEAVTDGDKEQVKFGYPKVETLDLEGRVERKSVETLYQRFFKGSDYNENLGMRRKWPKIRKGGTRIDEQFCDKEMKSKQGKLAKGEGESNSDESYDELGF